MEDDIQLRIVRAMTPEQKLKAAQDVYESIRMLKTGVLRRQHPEWTEDELQCAVRDMFRKLDQEVAERGLVTLWEETFCDK